MAKLIVAFRNFARALKNHSFLYISLYEIYSSFWCEEIPLEVCAVILDYILHITPIKQIPPAKREQGGTTLNTWTIFCLFLMGSLRWGVKLATQLCLLPRLRITAVSQLLAPLPLFCVFRARNVYVSGLLLDSLGMLLMALTRHRYAVIVFSAAAGVMYSTLFTVPYLLVAHYHASGTVRNGLE